MISATVIERLLELLITAGTLGIFHIRMKEAKGNTINDLITKLEERDRELERAKIQAHAWKIRYDHRTKKCESEHLHS